MTNIDDFMREFDMKVEPKFPSREWWVDLLDDIKMKLAQVIEFYYIVKVGIKNYWKFRKVIFFDRWWDYSFLNTLVTFKLKDMEDNWHKSFFLGNDFTRKRITVIRKAIETFEDDMDEALHDCIVEKKFSRDELKNVQKKIISRAYGRLGRNLQRFWD